jgi:hypothetical protein
MIEQNKPQTVATARKKIDQLHDSTDPGDLVYRYAVASGWLAALRTEGLVDRPTFDALMSELNETHGEVRESLPISE